MQGCIPICSLVVGDEAMHTDSRTDGPVVHIVT
jgi:hypothetical protein